MLNLTRCTMQSMPSTRPDTDFVDGVCTACLRHDAQQLIDWDQRRQDLHKLFDRNQRGSSGFDCIVASSGGKDSTAQVLALLDLGATPLVVTATTCMLTELGRENIDNLKRFASTIEVTPNQTVRARMNYLGLTKVGDISWPEHVAIFTTPMRMAASLGIPLVFYGENPQSAYGGPIGSQEAVQLTQRWVSEFGGLLGLRMTDVVGKDTGISQRDIAEYTFPTEKEIKRVGCEAHFLGQYIGPWDGRKNAEIAIAHGFKYESPSSTSWWEFENLDNAMTGIHDYFMFLKYGYNRACPQLSVDIRTGYISRDEAIPELHKREGHFPTRYAGVMLNEVLKHIGMETTEFFNVSERFTNRELFEEVSDGPRN